MYWYRTWQPTYYNLATKYCAIKKVSGNKNPSSSSTPVNELEPVHNDWNTVSEKDFLRDRIVFNPYIFERTSSDPRFFCKMHMAMYEFVISRKENPYVPQQFLDVT